MTAAWFPQTDVEHAMQHEIDTLRAEVERLQATKDTDTDCILALRAENERLTARAEKAEAYMDKFAAESNRLREALEAIAKGRWNTGKHKSGKTLTALQFARSALQSKGDA